ncbi:MAG: DUF2849 domain-containing protein [Pseudomonadota bacterium]
MANVQFKAVAANRLSDGIAVWATSAPGGFRWTETWAAVAPVALDADPGEVEALEAWAAAEAGRDHVVSERLIDVARDQQGYLPTRLRERIVAAGPTVRLDLGKQAEQSTHAVAA